MTQTLKAKLLSIAKKAIKAGDPSHDYEHSLRVLKLAEKIATLERADLDIIVPSALFHDVITYPKDHPKAKTASSQSGAWTEKTLSRIKMYPQEKIPLVVKAICQCSFSKGIRPNLLEAKILQDADRLEATGAISIMRTFASSGQMKRAFYRPNDPFCKHRKPEPLRWALDLFYTRLLRVERTMYTQPARAIARRRTLFLQAFLKELQKEFTDMKS